MSEQIVTDRPRERLRTHGAGALSDAEVLAVVLGTGGRDGVLALAARILTQVGGPGGLARASDADLSRVRGVGPAKAAEIVAALELGRRASRSLAGDRPQIFQPGDAADLLTPRMAHLEREESIVLILDRRHRVLREAIVGIGGVSHSPMEAREILTVTLREPGAAAILIAHNHPSGDPIPSTDDVAVTKRLARAADVVGIEFVDHLIIAARGWTSMVGSGAL